jgi:hypothetical protein
MRSSCGNKTESAWSSLSAEVNVLAHELQCLRLRSGAVSKPHPVPYTERNKDTKTLDYTSTPLDVNTLWLLHNYEFVKSHQISPRNFTDLKDRSWHLN